MTGADSDAIFWVLSFSSKSKKKDTLSCSLYNIWVRVHCTCSSLLIAAHATSIFFYSMKKKGRHTSKNARHSHKDGTKLSENGTSHFKKMPWSRTLLNMSRLIYTTLLKNIYANIRTRSPLNKTKTIIRKKW